MSTPLTPDALFRAALERDPARPFVTAYDDADGSRIELSYATFDNWVAKTANLLVDELCVDPGERVALALPTHWQRSVWLQACWSAGLVAVPCGPEPVTADVIVASPGTLDAALEAGARDVVGLSLHPLGAPLAETPPGVLDYAVEVRAHGDRFVSMSAPGADSPALEVGDVVLSGEQVTAAARDAAARWRLTSADRLCVFGTEPLVPTSDRVAAELTGPLTAGASVMYWSNPDMARLNDLFRDEKISMVSGFGVHLPDDPHPARRLD
ncbi:MAG: TIGR03089 family protein [Streptosporangiales bacterium]|nr:TIGR03089 family protein [Streptosporangiales bacterium]